MIDERAKGKRKTGFWREMPILVVVAIVVSSGLDKATWGGLKGLDPNVRRLILVGFLAAFATIGSTVADLFPPGQRGRPIGIYLMGQAVANGIYPSVKQGSKIKVLVVPTLARTRPPCPSVAIAATAIEAPREGNEAIGCSPRWCSSPCWSSLPMCSAAASSSNRPARRCAAQRRRTLRFCSRRWQWSRPAITG